MGVNNEGESSGVDMVDQQDRTEGQRGDGYGVPDLMIVELWLVGWCWVLTLDSRLLR